MRIFATKIVVRVDVRSSKRKNVKYTGDLSAIYHNMIDLVEFFNPDTAKYPSFIH